MTIVDVLCIIAMFIGSMIAFILVTALAGSFWHTLNNKINAYGAAIFTGALIFAVTFVCLIMR